MSTALLLKNAIEPVLFDRTSAFLAASTWGFVATAISLAAVAIISIFMTGTAAAKRFSALSVPYAYAIKALIVCIGIAAGIEVGYGRTYSTLRAESNTRSAKLASIVERHQFAVDAPGCNSHGQEYCVVTIFDSLPASQALSVNPYERREISVPGETAVQLDSAIRIATHGQVTLVSRAP